MNIEYLTRPPPPNEDGKLLLIDSI